MIYFLLKFCIFKYTNSTCIHNNNFRVCIIISYPHEISAITWRKNSSLNDIKHDRVCKSVAEIKDHAKNFPNAPRLMISVQYEEEKDMPVKVCSI